MAVSEFAYGPAYQARCAEFAVEAGCKGNTMGVLYCLFAQRGLWDWTTGNTLREISHSDLGAAMGGMSYNTIQKGITELRRAGVIDYADHRGRGTVWSNGEGKANRYKLKLPPITPSQKMGTPPPKKWVPPHPKNVDHYHNHISNMKSDTPSRREGDKALDDQRTADMRQFSQWVDQFGYGRARELEQERDAARRAAE